MAEPARKRRKVTSKSGSNQRFKQEYSTQWPVLVRGSTKHHALCTLCKSEFSVAHSGKYDCERHVEGAYHQHLADQQEAHVGTIDSLFSAQRKKADYSVINAEVLFSDFLVEHNVPLACSDHATMLHFQA